MSKQIKLILPLILIPILLWVVWMIGLPKSSDEKTSTVQDDTQKPLVITLEVPVTVEVTRQVTVVVTPTFTPIPPTPTALPAEWTIDDDPFLGSADAKVKVVEFSDYRCGFCRRFYQTTLYQLTDHYGDLVQFVYRDFPIFGEESLNGAIGAECAADQDKFWEFHNALFDNELLDDPLQLSPETLTQFARELDLDIETWNACFSSEETLNEIVFDYKTAQDWNVRGTPTFFINGKALVGAQPVEAFYRLIDAELVTQGIEPPYRVTATPIPTATLWYASSTPDDTSSNEDEG